MLNGCKKAKEPRKLKKRDKNKDKPNDNQQNNDFDEDKDEILPGPSTSQDSQPRYEENDEAFNDDQDDQDDEDNNERAENPRQFRELMAEIRWMLNKDSVFNRIRSELLDELEDIVNQHKVANARKKSDYRWRFEFYERLDDLVNTFTDLDEAHTAVLRSTAVQLAKHSPLEVMKNEQELEHTLFTTDQASNKRNDAMENASTKKSKKPKLIENWVNATTLKEGATPNEADIGSTRATTQKIDGLSLSTLENGDGVKTNDVNADKDPKEEPQNSVNTRFESPKPIRTARGADTSQKVYDNKPTSPYGESRDPDADPTSDMDTEDKSTNVGDSSRVVKKSNRKPTISNNTKSNGVSKASGEEKTNASNRKLSGRLATTSQKSSRTTDVDDKKKRRAAAIVATASVSESISSRPQAQRRATRNAQTVVDAATLSASINEQTYCLCDQISYGNMICCDNNQCTIEWFHFDCVKIKAKPAKGKKWFCPTCRGEKSTVMKASMK